MAAEAGTGMLAYVLVRSGRRGTAGRGKARPGKAGVVRLGMESWGRARRCDVRLGRHGTGGLQRNVEVWQAR